MANKSNIIYCEYCGWKIVTRDFSNLELKEISSESKNKKFKCPKCGRLIQSKQIDDPQKELEIQKNKQKHLEEYKKWIEDTIKNREDAHEEN